MLGGCKDNFSHFLHQMREVKSQLKFGFSVHISWASASHARNGGTNLKLSKWYFLLLAIALQ